jgi:predicted aminopeptidase
MLAEYRPTTRTAPFRAVLVGLALSVLPGCGTMYVTQAAMGEWHVMHSRRPIDDVVLDKSTPEPVREELFRVREAREFASSELKLPDNRSYTTYADLHRPYVVWNVVATPEFSVQPKRWCFPVAGCVAYRGYFSEHKAHDFAASLAGEGFDVAVGGVPAYSTLGKFADPVLSTMLSYGDDELAATIFHELAHQLLYVKNDSEFNEAFAMTVEEEGLRRWLERHGQAGAMVLYRRQREREREFVNLFSHTRDELAKLYASGEPPAQMRARKKEILGQLAVDLSALERRLRVHSSLYDEWIAKGLNNAHLTSLATYYDCLPGFERLLAEQNGDLQRFYDTARELSKLPHAERHERLCKRMPSSAPLNASGPG